ncbi:MULTISPECIES: S41 family peptidase [Vibrio]|uniref:S41 family peptidase n=1 Tax=Vibrio TaxID=662 RepID=UPI003D0E9CF6
MSSGTVSAAEDFLVYAQALDTMTTIGEYTYGSTGQPLFRNLPGGGCFRVCTKRDTYADGRDFVGTGIKPDILVSPTYQHLIDGVDYVLETAVELMTRNLQNEDSPLNSTDC